MLALRGAWPEDFGQLEFARLEPEEIERERAVNARGGESPVRAQSVRTSALNEQMNWSMW